MTTQTFLHFKVTIWDDVQELAANTDTIVHDSVLKEYYRIFNVYSYNYRITSGMAAVR